MVGTKQAVNDHFNTPEGNDTKSPEYQGMEKTDNGFAEYFSLDKGYFKHHPKPFAKITDREGLPRQLEKTYDALDGIGENSYGYKQRYSKNDLFNHHESISP